MTQDADAPAAAAPRDVLDTPEAGPRYIRGTALRVGGYAVGLLLGVGASALLLRHLGVVDAGRFVTVIALLTIVGGISDLGLSSLALREYAVREGAARERFQSNLLGMRAAYTTIGIVVALAFGAVAGYTTAMIAGILLYGFAVLLGALQQTLQVPLSAQLKLGWITVLVLMTQAGVALGYVILALAEAGLAAFFAVQAVATVPVLALTVWLVRGQTPLLPKFDRGEWIQTMKDILPYSAAVVFYVLYFRFAAVSVSLLSTEEETGYYGASFRVLDALTLVPPLLASSAFPLLARAARDDRDRLAYAMRRLFDAMLILGIWIGICLGVGAELAIDVVAGPGFEPSVDVLRVQAGAVIGTCMLATWGYGLLSLGRQRSIVLTNLLAVIVAAVLSVTLIPPHGALGAGISLTAAELVLALGYGVALWRADPATVGLGNVPKVALAAALALGVSLLVGAGPLAAMIVASVVYALVLLALRAFPEELMHAARDLRSRRAS